MRYSRKPVHKCHSCLLNCGDHCWLYHYPRGQWRNRERCKAFENEEMYARFREWLKLPDIKTSKDLRCEFFRTTKKRKHHHKYFLE